MENISINSQKKYKDIGQDEFALEVVEASKKYLIVVDFWAPWCGPCKDLGPRIEKIINQSNGKAKLIKINIDENQELAAQLQIQSIPTVFAFKNGKIANAFQGSISESEIIKFIEKALGEKLEVNYLQKINDARECFNKEMYEESNNLIEEIISRDGQNGETIELLIKNNIHLSNFEKASEIINALDNNMAKDLNVKSAIDAYKLAINTSEVSVDELINEVKESPLNIKSNKKLSDLYFSKKQYDEAFSLILNLFVKIKKDKKDEVKKILIEYFNILGHTHDKTKEIRRKFSSIIFS